MRNVTLILDDGTKFQGQSFGYEKPVAGEVVFNTAMSGYPENLTDPSYAGQILVLTYPLIGNYGVPTTEVGEYGLADFMESHHIQVSALICSAYSPAYSHWNAKESLGDWLKREEIPAITGIDTRELAKLLREKGVMNGRIVFEGDATEVTPVDYETENFVAPLSCKEIIRYNEGADKKVVLLDCGVQHNIVRSLIRRGVEVIRVPWNYDFNELEFDGLFLANGPGNPNVLGEAVAHIKTFLEGDKVRPCMGVCLGNELLALAAGAKVSKLKVGHRSHTQPVRKSGTNSCLITTQNHGYAVEANTLPAGWAVSYENMNDGTVQGICHQSNPWFAVQFQPEACTMPLDPDPMIDEFVNKL